MMRVRTRTSFCTNGDLARRAVELSVTRATQVHQGRRLRIPRRSIAATTLFLLCRCQSLEQHACDIEFQDTSSTKTEIPRITGLGLIPSLRSERRVRRIGDVRTTF